MKVKTSELIDFALDWAVAKTQGDTPVFRPHQNSKGATVYRNEGMRQAGIPFRPSLEWTQGGPIIDREKITTVCAEGDYNPSKAGTSECYDTYWVATKGRLSASTVYGPQGDDWGSCFQIEANAMQGSTSLIAAMRCFVASKLGEEVEVPDELFA